jgi:hypothetical protein
LRVAGVVAECSVFEQRRTAYKLGPTLCIRA